VPALPNDPNYVFKVPEYERMLHADADAKLSDLAKQLTARGITVRTIVGHGSAASEIVRTSEKENADLIVIATHGTSGWRHAMFGSVAERVVRLAKCPVLTIRGQQESL
jgi:nucleotide-binding universal stress UspA family protein